MPLATAVPLASYDQAAGETLDLSNELAEIIRRDNTSFLGRVGISGVATQTKHSWMEDSLNANSATTPNSAAGFLDDSETSLDVSAGHGLRFRPGTMFKDSATGKSEVIQVTGVSTDTLTIVRGYGGTTAQVHGVSAATGFSIQIISHPAQEGQDMPADESKIRTKVSNFTQIFQKGISVSHTMRAVNQAGVADEFSLQVSRRLMEVMRELDSALINGISSASQGSDTVYRSMGGIVQYASQAGGNVSSVSEALTLSVINTMCKQIWDDGGYPDFILVGGKQKRAIATFDQSARRSNYDTQTAGYVVDRIITDLGFMLDVIVDPQVPDDVIIIGDLDKVKVMPLANSAMHVEDIAKTGASTKAMIYGEYTAEFRNAKEAFAFHDNLS